jgi:hypothetical protein
MEYMNSLQIGPAAYAVPALLFAVGNVHPGRAVTCNPALLRLWYTDPPALSWKDWA